MPWIYFPKGDNGTDGLLVNLDRVSFIESRHGKKGVTLYLANGEVLSQVSHATMEKVSSAIRPFVDGLVTYK